MRDVSITNPCFECDGTMHGRVENYKYVESGLNTVVLKNILVFHCQQCGARMPQIVAAGVLHRKIAIALLRKDTRLTGDEVRFLRKAVGYSATELAKLAGTSKSVVSHWENASTFGQDTDRLIRLICVNKLLRDSLVGADFSPKDIEALLNKVQQLVSDVDDTLKKLRGKARGKKKQYFIDPAELSKYGDQEVGAEPEMAIQ